MSNLFVRPMRWGQLVFVENDPPDYDPDFWADYFKRTHCEGACLGAGGCVAFYPTEVPLHYRSKWLGDRDPFGEMVKRCRKMDMVVIARTDPHAAHRSVAEAQPDWLRKDIDGNFVPHWNHPDYYLTCTVGPYNFDFMTRVHQEILRLYDVDGVFINRWDQAALCYCAHCRKNFHDATGKEIPPKEDRADPLYLEWMDWREARLFQLWDLWYEAGKQVKPQAQVFPNTGGGAFSPMDMAIVGERMPMLPADRQARSGHIFPWILGRCAKECRATLREKPVMGLFSVGLEEKYRWKDSVQSPEELKLWVKSGIAQGMRPWFCKFGAVLNDDRWLKPVEEVFAWHHKHEKYLRNERSLARVGLVYSQQTMRKYAGEDVMGRLESHGLGMYQALVEARIPFEMFLDKCLQAEYLDGIKLLILPNNAALSDSQCDDVRAFVQRGGSLLATHETSLYDEHGQRRQDFGLADLFGVSYVSITDPPMKNAYLRLNHPHPLLEGLEDAPRIIHGTSRLEVRANVSFAEKPITLIPAYPDLPMEEVYTRGERPDMPELFLREWDGGGRVVYFNWDIDRVFWEIMANDHRVLLQNTIRWALIESPRVKVEGQGLFDLALWRQKDSMTLHLVNLTNPMAMKGPVREIIPSPPQRVRITLPEGTKAKRVKLLAKNEVPSVEIGKGFVALTVSVLDHEVVAVDLGP